VGKKTVDIIIPCYNGACFLSETLDSALGQTYSPVNVIVVDDGSTDSSRRIIGSYGDRVVYFYKDNGGQASARNAGILRTTGDYVCLLDADDIILPGMIEHLVGYLEQKPEVDVCHSKTLAFNDDNIVHPYAEQWRPFSVWDSYVEILSVICAIHGSSAVIRRRVFNKFGLFPEDRALQGCEDWHFWLQAALQGAVIEYISTVYTLYRQHSLSSSSQKLTLAARESELMKRAVHLFRMHGVAENRKWLILSYGIKSTALRWLALGEIIKFREMVELSRSIIPCCLLQPVDQMFSDPTNEAAPILLHFYLCRTFLDMGLQGLAGIMFVKCLDISMVRKLCEKTGRAEFFESTVRLVNDAATDHRSGPQGRLRAKVHGQKSINLRISNTSFRANVANPVPQEASFWGYVEHQLGVLEKSRKSLNEAEARFRRAIELNPNYGCTRFELADVLVRKGFYGQAAKEFRQGVEVDPKGIVSYIMACACRFMGVRSSVRLEAMLTRLRRRSIAKMIAYAVVRFARPFGGRRHVQ
jgi:glycosyltransferase involved in cell wall biosynthesis